MTSNSQKEEIKPKVNLVDKVLNRPWKKVVVALTLTVFVVGGSGFAFIWFTPSLKSQLFDKPQITIDNPKYQVVLSATDLKLLQFNPASLLIKKRSVKDLPIYPDSWRKGYFSESELKDSSVSGESADADNDALSNKEEYIYGSNPKNPDTLGAGGKDGEYVKAGRNPLSGLALENNNFSYYFLNTDLAILEEMNKNLDTLESVGINIPKLYEQSRQKDFSSELNDIKLNVIENPTREGSIDYINQRLLIVKDIVGGDYLSNLSNIYQLDKIEDLNSLKASNQGRILSLSSMGVPKQEVDFHKNLIYFFDQISDLIDLRIEVIEKGLERKDYDAKQQEIVLRAVWAHRQINDNINNLNPNL